MASNFEHIGDHELDEETKKKLEKVVDGFFERPLEKAEDFNWEEFRQNEAFKAIMMPSNLFWVLANFERSFTQKLGQQMYEKFGRAVANANDDVGDAETQRKIEDAQITPVEENRIETIIDQLAEGTREPDWEAEKQEILDIETDKATLKEIGDINWDLWIEDFEDGRPLVAEIKTPKPNKDQTMESKRQMLKTIAVFKHRDEPMPIPRFVFPFNPFGSVEDYSWWPPKNLFDIENSDGMMIDKDFWDGIGGENTMEGLFNFLLDNSEENRQKLKELAGESEI